MQREPFEAYVNEYVGVVRVVKQLSILSRNQVDFEVWKSVQLELEQSDYVFSYQELMNLAFSRQIPLQTNEAYVKGKKEAYERDTASIESLISDQAVARENYQVWSDILWKYGDLRRLMGLLDKCQQILNDKEAIPVLIQLLSVYFLLAQYQKCWTLVRALASHPLEDERYQFYVQFFLHLQGLVVGSSPQPLSADALSFSLPMVELALAPVEEEDAMSKAICRLSGLFSDKDVAMWYGMKVLLAEDRATFSGVFDQYEYLRTLLSGCMGMVSLVECIQTGRYQEFTAPYIALTMERCKYDPFYSSAHHLSQVVIDRSNHLHYLGCYDILPMQQFATVFCLSMEEAMQKILYYITSGKLAARIDGITGMVRMGPAIPPPVDAYEAECRMAAMMLQEGKEVALLAKERYLQKQWHIYNKHSLSKSSGM